MNLNNDQRRIYDVSCVALGAVLFVIRHAQYAFDNADQRADYSLREARTFVDMAIAKHPDLLKGL